MLKNLMLHMITMPGYSSALFDMVIALLKNYLSYLFVLNVQIVVELLFVRCSCHDLLLEFVVEF